VCHCPTIRDNGTPLKDIWQCDVCANECHAACADEPIRDEEDGRWYLKSFEAPPGYKILPKPEAFISEKELKKGLYYLLALTDDGDWCAGKIRKFKPTAKFNFEIQEVQFTTLVTEKYASLGAYHKVGVDSISGAWAYMKKERRNTVKVQPVPWYCQSCRQDRGAGSSQDEREKGG